MDDSNFPSDSTEETGRFASISENVGHDMTFSILNITTNKVISISNFRSAGEPSSPNLRVYSITTSEGVKYRRLTSNCFGDNEESHSFTEEA